MSEETLEKETKDTANNMIERLKLSKGLYSEYTKQFSSRYYVADKSLDEWRRYFRVDVPPDLSCQVARRLALRLMELFQEANYFKTEAELRLHGANAITKSSYREKFNDLIVSYKSTDKKLPAEKTLSTEAEAHIGKELDSITHIEIELSFWKGILNGLQEIRKLVETATWNLSVEARAIGHEAKMDNMNKDQF